MSRMATGSSSSASMAAAASRMSSGEDSKSLPSKEWAGIEAREAAARTQAVWKIRAIIEKYAPRSADTAKTGEVLGGALRF